MKTESVEKWVWVLIYVGMAIGMLGFWAWDGEATVAYVLSVLGGVMVAAGLLLVWLRSRMGKAADGGRGAPR
jgi:cyanate permease